MLDFLLATGNLPFTIALCVMFLIALIEGVGLLLGLGFASLLDSLLPELDLDVESPEFSGGALSKLLGWLRVGKVPLLMLLVVFLTAFGLIGLGLQALVGGLLGALLPWPLALVAALIASLPCVRVIGGALAYVMPKDETTAVSVESFVGAVAQITLGVATQGKPAQAKLKDAFRKTHYLMVEPDTLVRLRAYADAGADCLYAPGIVQRAHIEAVVAAVAPKPVNLLVGGPSAFTLQDIAAMGVRRVSLGGALARAAWSGFMHATRLLQEQGSFAGLEGATPGATLNALFDRPAPKQA